MPPPELPDAVRGRKLTLAQALAHIGGAEQLVDANGFAVIHQTARHFLWKYPDKLTHCTACGAVIENFYGHHGQGYACPACGMMCEFRFEAKGHGYVYDQFYLYQWRRSVLDAETIALTAAHVWRNSTRGHVPHTEQLHVEPTALYVFRPGRAVTVYKGGGVEWLMGYNGAASPSRTCGSAPRWTAVNDVRPEHTKHGGFNGIDIVFSRGEFRAAIEGTRIGATFEALREESGRWEDLELEAVANCARRPWLEYLAKAGQPFLAAQLMRESHIPKALGLRTGRKKPRELLNLTEGQWYEVRRDDLTLTVKALECLRKLEKMDVGPVKVAEALESARRRLDYSLDLLLPATGRSGYGENIADMIAPLPKKLRQRITRRILRELDRATEWRDYYSQLIRLGEIGTEALQVNPWRTLRRITEANTALLLPKDVRAMHQRMIEREAALRREEDIRKAEARAIGLDKRLPKMREKYAFRAAGLVLRPFESVREVVEEGRALHICIGSYATRYAEGGTILCCLRREEEPDEPWRAVEFSASTGKLVQDRGAHNDTPNGIPPGTRAQLSRFWAAFERAHRNERGRKSA